MTGAAYVYRVERDIWGPGRAEISLIRELPPRRGLLGHRRGRDDHDRLVLFHRTFTSQFELQELERYAAELERAARHANEGTFGCFVATQSRGDAVVATLYERWFDGAHLRCEQLARREFDASDEGTLVASAEFVAELEAWAEQRNDERETSYLEASVEAAARDERALERATAANELARILAEDSAQP